MLPASIQSKLDELSNGISLSVLKSRVLDFQTRYRDAQAAQKDPIQDNIAALAYAQLRMPSTYAVAQTVLSNLHTSAGDIKTSLDIGSGTGALLLAVNEHFPQVAQYGVETNPHMLALSKKLCDGLDIQFIESKIQNLKLDQSFDLITVSYVLNEINDNKASLIEKLWSYTNKFLVIIEAGTPRGFNIITTARDIVRRHGGHIFAPCPHVLDCPLAVNETDRWCHFEQRIARSKIHKQLKPDAVRGFEDEPYSYIILSKQPQVAERNYNRLISRVHGTKILSADLCHSDGSVKRITASKRDAVYSILRRAAWGDEIN